MMQATLNLLAWCVVAGVIVYAAVNPHSGVVYQSPLSAVGLGMIGLGIYLEQRQRQVRQQDRRASESLR